MARVELPQSKIKARKRRRRVRIAIVVAVACVVVVGALAALFHAPFLRVTDVSVTGAQMLNAGEIKALVQQKLSGNYLFIFPKDDILLYPQTSLEQDLLAAYPALKSVEVHADNFHTVGVVLHERQAAAAWCPSASSGQAQDCYLMDEDGVVFAPLFATSTDLYVTYSGAASGDKLPKQYLTADMFQSLAAFVAALSQTELGDPIRQVAVDEHNDARAYFQNNFLLIFSINDPAGDVFERFTLARKADPLAGHALSDIEYVDLRFGDKLYYKLKTP